MTMSLRCAIVVVVRANLFRELMMKAAASTKSRRQTLNLRIQPAARSLIDRAAEATGKTRTEFILEAACCAAQDELLDRALMAVSPQAYAEFLARLDAPAKTNAQLRKTMQAPQPWARR